MPLDLVQAAFDPGADEELGLFVTAVVLDAFGFAFDVFVLAVTFLTETRQAIGPTGGNALLETVSVLGDDQFAGTQLQRPLTHHDVALENLHFLDVVDADPVGFDVDRFFAVALFRQHDGRQGGQQ